MASESVEMTGEAGVGPLTRFLVVVVSCSSGAFGSVLDVIAGVTGTCSVSGCPTPGIKGSGEKLLTTTYCV